MEVPDFNTKDELFDFLVKNKSTLIAQKKAELKRADAISFAPQLVLLKQDADKSESKVENINELKVTAVINTTNLLDSHGDVHVPGLWNKSLKENKSVMHLQEHEMKFSSIISDNDDLKAYVKTFTWKQLGFDYKGETEALVFESTIKRERNPFMFDQYQKGYVKNHSVGMRYIKLVLAINKENEGAEYEAWEKYFPSIANKEEAERQGYFWVVKEAMVIEGSAVPRGSNWATPTLSVKSEKEDEPEQSTLETNKQEPPAGTQNAIDYKYLTENFKLKIS